MSRVLITGHAGFIGSHTLEAFIEDGWECFGIDDYTTGRHENVAHLKDKFVEYHTSVTFGNNIIHEGFADLAIKTIRPDVIVHLAAQPSLLESKKNPSTDAMTNIIASINLAMAAKRYGVKGFVFASTSAVYDPNFDEDYPVNDLNCPKKPNTPYGISKLAAENYIYQIVENFAILRYGNVYGPRQHPLGENQLIPRIIRHHLFDDDFWINGDGKQVRDFVFVKDVAKSNLNAAKSLIDNNHCNHCKIITNVGTGKSLSVIDVIGHVRHFLGIDNLLPVKKYYNFQGSDDRNVFLDIKSTKTLIGFQPFYPVREGIRETVNWWLEGKSDD